MDGRDLGIFEGQPKDEAVSRSNPPGGEDYSVFFTRIQRGLQKILTAHEAPVLIVSHTGAFRAMGGMYGFPVKNKPKNCRLYEFRPAPGKTPWPWKVFSHNLDEVQNRVICTSADLYDFNKKIWKRLIMLPAKPFYMIRHGQTEANRDCIMAGSLDSPLTDTGRGRGQARHVQDVVQTLESKPSLIVHTQSRALAGYRCDH